MVFQYNTIQIFFPIMNSVIFLQKSLQNIYINYKNELKQYINVIRVETKVERNEHIYVEKQKKRRFIKYKFINTTKNNTHVIQ